MHLVVLLRKHRSVVVGGNVVPQPPFPVGYVVGGDIVALITGDLGERFSEDPVN